MPYYHSDCNQPPPPARDLINTCTPRIPTIHDLGFYFYGKKACPSWNHRTNDFYVDYRNAPPETETGVPFGLNIHNSADNDEKLSHLESSNVESDGEKYWHACKGIATMTVMYRGKQCLYVSGTDDTPEGTIIAQRFVGHHREHLCLNPYATIPNPYLPEPKYVAGPNPLFETPFAIFDWVLVGAI